MTNIANDWFLSLSLPQHHGQLRQAPNTHTHKTHTHKHSKTNEINHNKNEE